MHLDIAVGFDFDPALGIDNKLEKETALSLLASFARAHGTTYDPAAADAAIDRVLATYRSHLDERIEAAIAGFLESVVPAEPDVIEEAMRFRELAVAQAPQHVRALPGSTELLARLDELGIPYALLTNGWSPLQEEKARLIGFRGPVYVSERIGANKPTRAAFDTLAKFFALPFERIWYVGDDPRVDCAGAQRLGMTSVWFDWEGKTYPSELPAPDHVIGALDELPVLLQGQVKKAAKLSE